MAPGGGILVSAEALSAWAARVFAACGMPDGDAATAAGILVRTSLRGFDSHGIVRMRLYTGRLKSGEVDPRPVHGGETRGGTIFYRCGNGLGQVVADAALKVALAASETQPVVPCLMEGCGHLSALGIFTLMAAEAGRVAFLCQTTKPWVAMPGWTSRAIGNDPLSFAAPLAGRPPIVFDIAASVASRGAVMDAKRDGLPIPAGWAIGPDGEPATDAATAAAGAMLPVGGYKGIGLAMLVEVLAGSLIARAGEPPGGRNRPGAFLLLVNPALTAGDDFAADMDGWMARYRAAAPDGAARYPGERAAECEAERLATGIPLAPALHDDLADLGRALGVPFVPG